MKRKRIFGRYNTGFSCLLSASLFGVLLGAVLLLAPGTAHAQREEGAGLVFGSGLPTERPKWLKAWEVPKVPENYRSPGKLHKVILEKGDTIQARVLKMISPLAVYQYQHRKLYLLSTSQLDKLTPGQRKVLNIRDDLNLIRLRDRFFDTSAPAPTVPEILRLVPKQESQLHLIQFVGPVQDDWIASLRRIEGITIVDYIPENAYLLWADEGTRKSVADRAGFEYYVQWHGPFHPAYKIHPAFDLEFDGEVNAIIQLVTHEGVERTIATIKAKAREVLRDTYRVGPYTNILIKLPVPELVNIARFECVVNVEPWIEPQLGGERQGQIMANQLNAAGSQPTGPGYLAWLNGLGFNTTFDFVVDVADGGIDRGQITAANLHQDFLDATGNNSRVEYVQQVSGATIDVTAANNNDIGGHGTIDLAIVGGFNNTADIPGAGTDFEDAAGYQYGLGIAPFARLGSSRIFAPGWTFPDYTELINAAYGKGARISSNSWGDRDGANGSYSAESQEYDALVRDARPSTAGDGGENGNQEMCIVFLAGNSGPGASTLWNLGSTAKNTFVVGAGENFNATGDADGCNPWGCCDNNDADDIRDVANFSSHGPCDGPNGRVKPDIMAPGTHIFGAASQDPNYDGTDVCGGPDNYTAGYNPNEDAYYPPDNCNDGNHPGGICNPAQTLYTWSSGTSHSTPAVAGGAALFRQWFVDSGHPAPSPAMTKAFLMNTATHMTGTGANDDLPSNNQGMGRMNLGMAFDDTPRLLFDQVKTCYSANAGEVFTVNGQVADATRPFRVTLAWTDDAGAAVAGGVLKNDLDLEVQVGGNFYRGNDFTLGISNPGAPADLPDDLNNVESVFLPAGTIGNFTATVRPTTINDDGVPNNSDPDDQDFALVIYNAEFPARDPVDIVLVLDCSGSMNDVASGGTEQKINLLKDAVEVFARCWEPYAVQNDSMAVVYFNSTLGSYPSPPALLPFSANANAIITDVRLVNASTCTGLGGGIRQAYDLLETSEQPKIIVFTDGMQNCTPKVVEQPGGDLVLKDETSTCGTCNHTALGTGTEISLSDKGIPIHTIGTGVYGGSSWWALLEDIADVTDATSHFASEPDEDLEDYFLETLVECLREDPVEKVKTVSGTIARNAPAEEAQFSLNSSVRRATFALSWRGERRENALTFALIAPDERTIPPQLMSVKTGEFYSIATATFPINYHGTEIGAGGIWKARISPNLESAQVSYRVHLIVDEGQLRYDFEVPAADYGVGDVIPLSFWIQQGNRTLSNLARQVEVSVDRPPIGFGTFMVKHPVSKGQLDRTIDLAGDGFPNLAAKKGYILVHDAILRKELDPAVDTVVLFDDGKTEHGDPKANDGVYSALYRKTERPGLYNFTLSFSGRDPELGTVARSESKTILVGMKHFDLEQSSIDIKWVRALEGKLAYVVNVLLIDSYGNHLGPGHSLDVVVAPPGKKWGPIGRRVGLDDNLDGSYSGRVELTEAEANSGAILELDVDGHRLATVMPPPFRRWSVSVHSGAAIPTGSFANDFDPGYNALLDIDYHFSPQLALVGFAGYNAFASKTAGVDDTYWVNLSLNIRYYWPLMLMPGPPSLSLYVGAGPGIYIPKDGDTDLGANAGGGISYDVNAFLTLEAGADYHSIFDPNIQFVHSHAGVIFRF